MKILVDRFTSDNDATLSSVSVNGEFECFGLEDEYRDTKKSNETRIPAGIYDIELRTTGGFHTRYKKKFPVWHGGMLQVMDVPNFQYILIHIGNTDEDTAGCLLVGSGASTSGELKVQSSKIAYSNLYKKVFHAALNDNLTIEFKDNDRFIN